MIPAKPAQFHPEVPPPGFEKKLISFWQARPKITPRLQLIHTNGAPNEGTIESAYNWANQPGSDHTIPTCQIDRSGRGALLLPSDRKGIANYKAATFSLAFETADRGYLTDPYPTGSYFTDAQAEAVAVACAYYSVLHNIPLTYPATWDGSGTASHTEPFGYPLWTNSAGKPCPGDRKKAQVRDVILPRARAIKAAWTAPPPSPPTPTPTRKNGRTVYALIAHESGSDSFWFTVDGGLTRQGVRSPNQMSSLVRAGCKDAVTGTTITDANWTTASVLTVAQLTDRLGPVG